jgi:hypothetical protein
MNAVGGALMRRRNWSEMESRPGVCDGAQFEACPPTIAAFYADFNEHDVVMRYGSAHRKFAASSILPVPLY